MFHRQFHPLRLACAAAAIAAAVPVAASAAVSARTISATEQMLAAAGFQAVPANTAERQADLAALPAGRVIARPNGDGFTYVLADPTGCACLYLGDAGAYQAYQRLLLDRNAGRQYAYAVDPHSYDSLNWGLWGPFDGWGWQGSSLLRGGLGGHRGGFGGHGGGFDGHGGGSGGHGGPGQHGGRGQH